MIRTLFGSLRATEIWQISSARYIILLFFFGCTAVLNFGCAPTASKGRASGDLLALFESAAMAGNASGNESVMVSDFARGGVRRRCLVTIAPSEFAFALDGSGGRAKLTFYLGMAFNLGDGAEARIYLEEDGERRLVFSRALDPARRRSDRDWIPVELELTRRSGSRLVLAALPNSADLTGDWILWGEPRLSLPEDNR